MEYMFHHLLLLLMSPQGIKYMEVMFHHLLLLTSRHTVHGVYVPPLIAITHVTSGHKVHGGYVPPLVIGYGKTAHFAHYFKIELLVFKGSVDLKQ